MARHASLAFGAGRPSLSTDGQVGRHLALTGLPCRDVSGTEWLNDVRPAKSVEDPSEQVGVCEDEWSEPHAFQQRWETEYV